MVHVERITKEDREREPFRWCVYCDADCEVDEPEHAPECPSSTGVYVVRYEGSLHRPCEHCGKRPDPSIRCAECECLIGLGESYTHRQVGEGDLMGVGLVAPIYETVCLGCAAQEALTS